MWAIILISMAMILAIVDMWAYYSGSQKTLSKKVVEWTSQWPLLAFFVGLAVGVLAGHWWPVG